jgi:CelD/BcsL family acetyltransferase involved in cellulose biosynthesis
MTITTQVHGDADSLAALAPAWRELWRRSAAATPFQTPDWLIAWWRNFTPGRLLAVSAWRGDRLVGLAPFYVENGPAESRLLPLGMSVSDYLDLLLDPDEADGTGAALAQGLAAADRSWTRCDLEELPPWACALRLPAPPGCSELVAPQSACPVLALPGEAGGLASCLSRSKRNHLRLARNRTRREGDATIDSLDGNAKGGLAILLDLHAARWRSRGEPGVLASDAVRRFHEQAIEGLAGDGLLRFYVLRIGERTVGAYYGFHHGARAYAYLMGFDPALERISPGTVLLAHAIEQAIREGAREFHFLRGQEPYKYGWGAGDRWNQRRSFRRMAA